MPMAAREVPRAPVAMAVMAVLALLAEVVQVMVVAVPVGTPVAPVGNTVLAQRLHQVAVAVAPL